MSRKDGMAIGFTIQVEQFEPIKYSAFSEEEIEDWDGDEEDLNLILAKRCMKRLDDLAPEIAKKVDSIKQKILEELSNDED